MESQDVISGLLRELEKSGNEDARMRAAQRIEGIMFGESSTSSRNWLYVDALRVFLSDQNDVVRYWVAMALGHIGPPAIEAVPDLLIALDDRVSDYGSKNSSSGIRVALDRIDPGWRKRPDVSKRVLARWPSN